MFCSMLTMLIKTKQQIKTNRSSISLYIHIQKGLRNLEKFKDISCLYKLENMYLIKIHLFKISNRYAVMVHVGFWYSL